MTFSMGFMCGVLTIVGLLVYAAIVNGKDRL